MGNNFDLKKFLVENKLTTSSITLREVQENSIKSLVADFYETGMKMSDSTKAKEYISNRLDRQLTPIEKSKITKEFDKLYLADMGTDDKKRQEEEYAEKLKRAQKNLLPLELDNHSFTPDPYYYEPNRKYISGKGGTSIEVDNPDGTLSYVLKDKFKNTPITGTIKVNGKDYNIPAFYKNFYQGLL